MTARLNVLIAYPYCDARSIEQIANLGDNIRWLLDSGAFTAWKLKKVITLDEYCSFIERLPVKPWRYLTLDVIGDPVASQKNYDIMRARGFDPIPIVTRGASLAELDAYYETTDLVGLGGVAGADRASYAWVKAVMAHVGERRAHILGFTSMNWLKFCRPYSADSSSWLTAARYGRTRVYMGDGHFEQIWRKDVAEAPPSDRVMARIRAYGIDPYQMQKHASWKGALSPMSQLSATSWIAASIELERHVGSLLFLALPNTIFMRGVTMAYRQLLTSGLI